MKQYATNLICNKNLMTQGTADGLVIVLELRSLFTVLSSERFSIWTLFPQLGKPSDITRANLGLLLGSLQHILQVTRTSTAERLVPSPLRKRSDNETKAMWLNTPRGAGNDVSPAPHPSKYRISIDYSLSNRSYQGPSRFQNSFSQKGWLVFRMCSPSFQKRVPQRSQAGAVCMAWLLLPSLWLSADAGAPDALNAPLLIGGVEFSQEDDIEAWARRWMIGT